MSKEGTLQPLVVKAIVATWMQQVFGERVPTDAVDVVRVRGSRALVRTAPAYAFALQSAMVCCSEFARQPCRVRVLQQSSTAIDWTSDTAP